LEEEDPDDRIYYCAMCKGVLDYDKHLEAHLCKSYVQYYDTTNIQDTPLKDIKDFQLAPYSQLQNYPVFDENDPNMPFVEGIRLDELEKEEGLETRTYDNGRIQHINLHNVIFADAIIKSNVCKEKGRR
jgi:hypothetical protein